MKKPLRLHEVKVEGFVLGDSMRAVPLAEIEYVARVSCCNVEVYVRVYQIDIERNADHLAELLGNKFACAFACLQDALDAQGEAAIAAP